MGARDPRLTAALDELLPLRAEKREWQRIVEDAGNARRPQHIARKRWLAVAIVIVLVVAPVTALGVSHGWWFSKIGPRPLGPVVVVSTGTWGGAKWSFTAYRSAKHGLCFAITPGGEANARGAGAALSCVPGNSPRHGVSYMTGFSERLPEYIAGHVIPGARTVEVVFAAGRSLEISTIAAPHALGLPVRFYASALPHDHAQVVSLVARDDRHRVVAHLDVLIPRARAFFHLTNRGRLVQLSPRLQHRLTLAHRSTHIELLATRDGRNFYRFGRGSCYGVGRAGDPATFDPRTIPAAFGSVACDRSPFAFPSVQRPVLDLSVWGRIRGVSGLTLVSLQGFASDGVVAVNLLDRHGALALRVPVVGNVYTTAAAVPRITVLVPVDAQGRELARCGPNGASTRVHTSGTYLNARC